MQFTSRSVSDTYLMMCGFFFPFSGEGWGVGGVGLFLMFLFLLIQSTHSLLRVGDRNPYGSSNQRSHSNFSWGEALNINFPPSSVCVPLCVSIALIFFFLQCLWTSIWHLKDYNLRRILLLFGRKKPFLPAWHFIEPSWWFSQERPDCWFSQRRDMLFLCGIL